MTIGALIQIPRGNSRILSGTIFDTAAPPVAFNATGYVLKFKVLAPRAEVATIGPFASNDAGTPKPVWTDIATGTFTITLASTDTDQEKGVYEAEVFLDNGTTAGKITVLRFGLEITESSFA